VGRRRGLVWNRGSSTSLLRSFVGIRSRRRLEMGGVEPPSEKMILRSATRLACACFSSNVYSTSKVSSDQLKYYFEIGTFSTYRFLLPLNEPDSRSRVSLGQAPVRLGSGYRLGSNCVLIFCIVVMVCT